MIKKLLLIVLAAMQFSASHAQQPAGGNETVQLWYEAFDRHNAALLDTILSPDWMDIPPMPGQMAGPAGARQVMAAIELSFPHFRIEIKEVLQDGNKVVVRSKIKATQRGPFAGHAATGRGITIMAIDIHEVQSGKNVRTWHMEDWMSSLHQLGIIGVH